MDLEKSFFFCLRAKGREKLMRGLIFRSVSNEWEKMSPPCTGEQENQIIL